MSLVADYSDSEEESEDSSSTSRNVVPSQTNIEQNRRNISANANCHNKPDTFFNLSTNSDESEEEDSIDVAELESYVSKSQQTKSIELGNPFRNNGSSIDSVTKADSVFQIPFLEQEIQKSASLERHVKMTDQAGTQKMINGKKVCWNYRKGKCRRGHACQFAHDSDIQQISEPQTTEKTPNPALSNVGGGSEIKDKDETLKYEENAVVSSAHLSTKSSTSGHTTTISDLSPERRPHSNDGIGKKGKKRVGLSNNLNPPKKSMQLYKKFNPS